MGHLRIRLLVPVAGLLCSCGPSVLERDSLLSVERSTLTVASQEAVADGSSPIALTVTARNALGAPLLGRTVEVLVSGSRNTLSVEKAKTDVTGTATVLLTSTKAETKEVVGIVDGLLVGQVGVKFVPSIAAKLEFTGQPTTTTAGLPLIGVTVMAHDAYENPAPLSGDLTISVKAEVDGAVAFEVPID